MTHNDAAAELAELGKSDARILSKMEAREDRLAEDRAALRMNAARRCAILSSFARAACDAGHIDGDVAALVAEPKD